MIKDLIDKFIRGGAKVLYYTIARFLPKYPIPGYQIAYKIRYILCKYIFAEIGKDVLIKRNVYFGDGSKIHIGNRSQLGINSIMDNDIVIGNDVIMGPDVIIYTSSHEYQELGIPINQQGQKEHRPVQIGNNVWIGARCIILPGVKIGDNAIIGANTVITEDVPDRAVFCGQKGRVVKYR